MRPVSHTNSENAAKHNVTLNVSKDSDTKTKLQCGTTVGSLCAE